MASVHVRAGEIFIFGFAGLRVAARVARIEPRRLWSARPLACLWRIDTVPNLHYSQKWSTEEFFRESEQP
jgi:hypothetical protein